MVLFASIFSLVLLYSCSGKSLPEEHIRPTRMEVNHAVSDTLKNLLLNTKLACTGQKDSIIIDSTSWVYCLGEQNNKKIYLVISGFGYVGNGYAIDIIQEMNDEFTEIQDFYTFLDSISVDSTKSICDLNLYYQHLLFEQQSPVSVKYAWDGNRFQFDQINYVVSTSNHVYSYNLLKLMGIIRDQDILPSPPFLGNETHQSQLNINYMGIDTIYQSRDVMHLVFKNKYLSYGLTDNIWIIKKQNTNYTILGKFNNPDYSFVEYTFNDRHPEIHFGEKRITWKGNKYKLSNE